MYEWWCQVKILKITENVTGFPNSHSFIQSHLLFWVTHIVGELEPFIPSVVGNTSSPSVLVSASFPVLSNTSAKLSTGICW